MLDRAIREHSGAGILKGMEMSVGVSVGRTLRAESGASVFCIGPASMRVVPRNERKYRPVPEYADIFRGGTFLFHKQNFFVSRIPESKPITFQVRSEQHGIFDRS